MIPYRYALRRSMMLSGERIIASGDFGDNAHWQLDSNGLLSITGTGSMKISSYRTPWYNYINQIITVDIEYGITDIGDYAFQQCENLILVTIPNSVSSIGIYAFYGCLALTSITIPSGVSTIKTFALAWCENLNTITIYDSITSIWQSVFYKSTNLSDVYYTGTQQQWQAISISSGNDPLLNATIHYNS